ncbi:MAG TPA: exodeoxyribonuclease VII small subunit [Firmicutes bacterium]|nr:exodeoxyribonuclease VII small subunit [Bacillales bacterium]HJA40717.1 exodeoxyribonuclease VII small subunit [Bacillota bacterium]
MEKHDLSFEASLQKLEEIVQKLEQGEVLLEDALKYYEDGMNYAKICHDKLKEADTQITRVLQENGSMTDFQSIKGE